MRRGLAPLLAAPAPALAHDLSAQYGAFLGPALHVFTEIDHLAAFLAVGLLAGQQTPPARILGLNLFWIALVCGIAAPFAFDGIRGFASAEGLLTSATLLVAGVMVALGRRLPAWLVGMTSGGVGFVHGLANALAFAADTHVALSMLGAGVAAVLVAAAGTLLAAVLDGPRGRIVVRVPGSWLAALGLMLLGFALTPK